MVLDAATANRFVLDWLAEVANVRTHATLKERPKDLWQDDLVQLRPVPSAFERNGAPLIERFPVPIESIQHPLSIYGELLEVAA